MHDEIEPIDRLGTIDFAKCRRNIYRHLACECDYRIHA